MLGAVFAGAFAFEMYVPLDVARELDGWPRC
jgi:hypothetical protein